MEEVYDRVRILQRDLNTLEHMIYVSCKFTRTTEMLRKVMEQMVSTYENFFGIAYQVLLDEQSLNGDISDRIHMLTQILVDRGVVADLSEYFLSFLSFVLLSSASLCAFFLFKASLNFLVAFSL